MLLCPEIKAGTLVNLLSPSYLWELFHNKTIRPVIAAEGADVKVGVIQHTCVKPWLSRAALRVYPHYHT